MKTFLIVISILIAGVLLVLAMADGLEKEQRRQCLVAIDYCENYGACDDKYLQVCDGVDL